MKPVAVAVSSRPGKNGMIQASQLNVSRLDRDFSLRRPEKYEAFWKDRAKSPLAPDVFARKSIYLEIGAGTGWLFLELARRNPEHYFIAVERDRMRGNRLVHRAEKSGLENFSAHRGNIIPWLINSIPDQSLDRIYVLYPCPWPKTSHRKNRWYLHPIMPHIVRALKKDGIIVWASDQRFYIDEAAHISATKYPLKTLAHGPLAPNPWNHLEEFPKGRTKFESHFLATGQECHELVVQKS